MLADVLLRDARLRWLPYTANRNTGADADACTRVNTDPCADAHSHPPADGLNGASVDSQSRREWCVQACTRLRRAAFASRV